MPPPSVASQSPLRVKCMTCFAVHFSESRIDILTETGEQDGSPYRLTDEQAADYAFGYPALRSLFLP
jgi:hypothetical protein